MSVSGGQTKQAGVARRTARRGWRRRVLIVVAALLAIFVAATAWILVWPGQGGPGRVSAIVMLAGPGDRLSVAVQLAREHRAPVLVVSRGNLGYAGPCPPAIPAVRTICFDPDPADTRGEAEYVGKLARKYGWRSILLVTSRPQGTRARLIVGRCFSGQIYLSTAPLQWQSWPYQIVYGWAALLKAAVLVRGC